MVSFTRKADANPTTGLLGDLVTANDVNELQSALETVDRRTTAWVDVRDYGAVGDGATDNGPAIAAAATALLAAGGGRLVFPPAVAYRIATTQTIVASNRLIVDLGGQRIRCDGAVLAFQGVAQPSLTLASDAARGDKTVTVTDATGVQRGDLIDLNQNTTAETTFTTKRRAIAVVRAVAGAVITLTAPLKIPFAAASTTVARYRHASPFVIKNGELEVVAPATAQTAPLSLRYLRNPVLRDLRAFADQAWIAGGPNGWGFDAGNLAGAQWSNVAVEGLSYGIALQNCLSTNINGMRARNVRHPVVPSTWSVGVRVGNLTTEDCYESIDSHPAFDVAYANVFAARDETFPNLRCVGGMIEHATVYCDATDTDQGPQYHSLALVDPTWYTEETLTLRDFRIIAPALTKAAIGASFGRVIADNVVAQTDPAAASFFNTLQEVRIGNCRNPDGTPWGRVAMRAAVRRHAPPNLPAYLATQYHIDPRKEVTDQSAGVLRCYGRILEAFATDPVAISLRIHDNAFPETDTPSWVFGVLRLRATVRHSNSGVFDVLTKDFQFVHKISATSSVTWPLVAAYTDGATGQTNESLVLTIATPVQNGATELGTGSDKDFYAQIDVAISSGRTAPIYGLTYELELARG